MKSRSVTSLRAMILVGILGIEVLTAAAFIATTYPYARATSLEHADSRLNSALDLSFREAARFANGVGRLARFIDTLAASELLHLEETEATERIFAEVLRSEPRLSGAFLGTEDGSFIYVTREFEGLAERETLSRIIIRDGDSRMEQVLVRGPDFQVRRELDQDLGRYDPRERPWYRNAQAADGIVWSDPYIFFTSQQPGVTVSRRSGVGPDRSVSGVIGLDVSLARLSAFTDDLRASANGILAVVDSTGRVLAHPRTLSNGDYAAMDELPRIQDGGYPVLQKAMEEAGLLDGAMEERDRQTIMVDVDGQKHLVAFDFLNTLNQQWIIAVRVPVSDFLGWFNQVIYATIVTTIALAIAGIAVGMLLSKRIGLRLRRMQDAARQLANDQDEAFQYSRSGFSELEETENALGLMSAKIVAREKELRETNNRLSDIMRAVDQMPVGIVVFDLNGPIRFVNSLAATVLRFDGHDQECFDLASAKRIDAMRAGGADAPSLAQAIETRSQWETDIVYRGHGDELTFRAIAVPIGRGQSQRWVFALEDRTAQRRIESDLREAYDAALEASAAKTNFLANMSHELRTPLNAILGYSQALLSGIFGEIPDARHHDYVTNIEQSGVVLHETLSNLLDLTAIESGSMRLKAEPHEIDTLVKSAVENSAHALKAAGIEPTLDLGAPAAASLDGIKVRQAIVNLIQNSCKYAFGATRLTIRTRDAEDGQIQVEVEDDGPGIPVNLREEALRPFRRTDVDAQIAIDNGVGLGLPIAKAIAELHGGWLSLDTATGGKGLKVTLTLSRTQPLADAS
ncbi:MAG: cache domain-containing protein [Alphaproteobacteria bacterium]